MRTILLLLTAALITVNGNSQGRVATIHLDSDTIHFGRQVATTVVHSVQCSEPEIQLWVDLSEITDQNASDGKASASGPADVQIVFSSDSGCSESEGIVRCPCAKDSIRFGLRFYNTGRFLIPNPLLIGKAGDTILPSIGGSELIVVPPPGKTESDTELLDIKPIREIPYSLGEFLPYMVAVALLIGLILVLKRWWRRRNTGPSVPIVTEEETVVIPPHEVALAALKKLRMEEQWKTGRIKEFQSELTSVIRIYLSDAFHIDAPEMTTQQIRNAMQSRHNLSRYSEEVNEVLTVADLVKFAKARPGEDVHLSFLDKAESFIEKTKTIYDVA